MTPIMGVGLILGKPLSLYQSSFLPLYLCVTLDDDDLRLVCAVLFLRGYTLKRVVRKAGNEEQQKGEPDTEAEAEAEGQAKLAANAPVAPVSEKGDVVSPDDAATVHGEPSVENGEKKVNDSPV